MGDGMCRKENKKRCDTFRRSKSCTVFHGVMDDHLRCLRAAARDSGDLRRGRNALGDDLHARKVVDWHGSGSMLCLL